MWDPGPEWPAGHGPSIGDVRIGGTSLRSVHPPDCAVSSVAKDFVRIPAKDISGRVDAGHTAERIWFCSSRFRMATTLMAHSSALSILFWP